MGLVLHAAVALAGAAVVLAECSNPAPAPPLADEAYALLNVLTTEYSPREIGSDREMEAALSLQGKLSMSGYETSLQEFGTSYTFRPSYMFYTDTPLESGVADAVLAPIRPHLLPAHPASPPRGFVTGPLTPVGDTSRMDIPERGLEGRIALIVPGAKSDDETLRRVTRAGAVGAIIIVDMEDTEVSDEITVPTAKDMDPFSTPPDPRIITVVSVGRGKGNALLELVERGELTASIKVDVMKQPLWNVVANMGGTEKTGHSVILGAHYDTVEETQGASDNGSGVAVLMTVARHIAERDYPFDVRIVLFGAEEEGQFGSGQYVEDMSREGIDGTIAMLNLDAVGSGTSLTATGDFDLVSEAIETGRNFGAPIIRETGGMASSAHTPFEEAGIPTLFLSSNDLSRINSPDDTIEHINPDLLGYAAEVAIAMLDSLAEKMR